MPQRRRAAFSAGLAGIAKVGEGMVKQGMLDQQNAVIIQRQTLDDLTTKVMKGEIEPSQAEQAMGKLGFRTPKGYFDDLQPTPEAEMTKLTEGIRKAGTMQEVPGERDISTQYAKRRPLLGFGQTAYQGAAPGTDETADGNVPSRSFGNVTAPDLQNVFNIRNDKLNSFAPIKQSEQLPNGEKRDTFIPARADQLTNRSFTTELSNVVQGQNKAQGDLAEQNVRNAGGMGALKGAETKSTLLAGELSPEVTNARADAAAKEARSRKHAELQEEMNTLGMLPQQMTAAMQLSDDYENQSKEYFLRESAFRDMARLSKDATTNPASGIGLVFKLMKLYDPASTVREGEQNQARNTAPLVPDWLWLKYNSMLNGQGILDQNQVNQFLTSAKQIYEGEAVGQKQRDQIFTDRANQYRISPHLVVRPPAPDVTAASANVGRLRVLSTDPNAGTPLR